MSRESEYFRPGDLVKDVFDETYSVIITVRSEQETPDYLVAYETTSKRWILAGQYHDDLILVRKLTREELLTHCIKDVRDLANDQSSV